MRTDDRRRRWNRLTAVVLAVTVGTALVACSSTPDPEPQASTAASTTQVPATSAPRTTQDDEADEAIAEDALLAVDEVPGGPWVEGDVRSTTPGAGLDCDDMASESDYFEEFAKGAPGAKAPELNDEATGATLQLDVNIVADEDIATTVAGSFADDRFPGCLEDRLRNEGADGSSSTTISDVSVEPLDIDPVGDSASAWTVSFIIEQGTQQAEIQGLIAFVQVGRGFSNVSIISEVPLTVDDLQPVLDEASTALTAALG